jgi:hypothetical protein
MPAKKRRKRRKTADLASLTAAKTRKIAADKKKRQILYEEAIKFYQDGYTYEDVTAKFGIARSTFAG